jgi:hypothetical protein
MHAPSSLRSAPEPRGPVRRLKLLLIFGLLSIGIHVLTMWKNAVEAELEPPGDDDDEESGHGRRKK